MSLTEAVSRITQLRSSLAAMEGRQAAPVAPPQTATVSAAPVAGTSFAGALAQAQGVAPATTAMKSLTPGQGQFAARLAQQTGLNPQVINAWLLAEESGGAAQSREAERNNNWLNIGWTDSGRYGTTNAIWSDPITAADATAGWLKGQNTIQGYGRAAPGVQAVLQTAGQPPQAQIAALQRSGWASSGYPDLPALLAQVSA